MTRMDDIDHTHPHTGEAFGANGGVFTRGPAAADGGTEDDEMRDIDHGAPGGDGATAVWDRGPEADATDDTDTTDEVKSTEQVTGKSTDE